MEMISQLHAPAVYPRGKSPEYPFGRRLGELYNCSGRGGKEKILSLPLPGIEPRSSNLYTDWAALSLNWFLTYHFMVIASLTMYNKDSVGNQAS
jgi:hypothetical protein